MILTVAYSFGPPCMHLEFKQLFTKVKYKVLFLNAYIVTNLKNIITISTFQVNMHLFSLFHFQIVASFSATPIWVSASTSG